MGARNSRPRRIPALSAIAALTALLSASAAEARPSKPVRPADPLVIAGAVARPLLGSNPNRVVAFRLTRGGRWRQAPVQVDERRKVDLGDVYGGTRNGIEIEVYADRTTLSGPDPDPTLDADDEIAMMARHLGPRRGLRRLNRLPRGLRRGPRVEIRATDPRSGKRGWAYLFEAGPRRDPAAGKDLVSYEFDLLAGSYPDAFDFRDGPNPERSFVRSAAYSLRFTDRWINDLLEITRGDSATRDLIDRRKVQFSPGVCNRSTDTFTRKEGAFVSNIDGPVRAIRSYVGANSGPMTQREHVFYDRREEEATFLRVHQISGVMAFIDYAPTPQTMRYRSSVGASVPIDGLPDPVSAVAPDWEQVYGPHGTLTSVARVETDVETLDYSRYYLDDSTPDEPEQIQCTGDGLAWGTSGVRVHGPIPNTDPLRGESSSLTGRRTLFYDRPDLRRRSAVRRAAWVEQPLRVRARRASPR
jgi:hypothetical protein